MRINNVVVSAIGTAMILYFIVSAFGYSTYGDNVESDILTNYPGKREWFCLDLSMLMMSRVFYAETYLTSFARLFVSLLVSFSYPLQCHPARRCIITLVSNVKDKYFPQAEDAKTLNTASPSNSDAPEEEAAEELQFNIITVST